MNKRIRQYIGIFSAVIIYYLVHEGAHLLTAFFFGVFKQINFMGIGIQVDVYQAQMTDTQMGVFCLAGAAATFLFGWLLVLLSKRICANISPVFRAVMWYTSLTMLLLDPLYLSVLCGFFGGGDMNGIAFLLPEAAARVVFAAVGLFHGIIVWRYLLPEYTASFTKEKAE